MGLVRSAEWLMNRGRADAYDLSPRRLVFAVLAERDEEKSELRRMAYAARLGQADDKGWSKAMKELTE